MDLNDTVIIHVIYDTGSSSYKLEFVANYSEYKRIKEDFLDISLLWLSFGGRLNDIDNNSIEYYVKRDSVISITCYKVNSLE